MASQFQGMVECFTRLLARGFPFLVAFCVLIFPAYKGVWLGYLPVALGAAVAWFTVRRAEPAGLLFRSPGWVLLYALPAVVQFILLLLVRPEPTFDGLFVYRQAVELAATGRMDPLTYYPPAMTWWYAAWFGLFGASAFVAQASHILLNLGVTWSTIQLARAAGCARAARVCGLLAAWYPTFLIYHLTTPYYHYLYTVLLVLMACGVATAGLAVSAASGTRAMGWAGLAAGAAALTKAVQLISPLQVAAWLFGKEVCWPAPGRGRSVRGWVVFAAAMLLVIGPWTWRNWRVFEDVVPVCTSGGLVLHSANNPESNGLYSETPDLVTIRNPQEMLAHSRWSSEQAKEFMRGNPVQFAGLALRKFLHTWGVESTFTELVNRRGVSIPALSDAFSFGCLLGWSALVFLWCWRTAVHIRAREPLLPFEAWAGILIISNAVVYMVFEGGDRHHLPLVPLIIILALPIARPRSDDA